MKMRAKSLMIIALCGFYITGVSQEQTKISQKLPSVTWSGYVKNDLFGDTRTTVSGREGHFLLWPQGPSYDANGSDLHEYNRLNILPIQSRLSAKISETEALGAKISGLIETDFFGQANDNINLLRMRHAYIKMKWDNTEIITGQYWNPLFITSCFPNTLSFNTGTPFNSFNRAPQIRLTHTAKDVTFIVAAVTQRDYTSYGPVGASYTYLSNAVYPNLHGQVHYSLQDSATKTSLLFGFGGESKLLVPRLVNENNEKVNETVNGMSVIAFVKLTTEAFTWKINARYGENNTDIMAPSGFALRDSSDGKTFTYTPLTNKAIWTDIHSNGKIWNIGLFAGYYKNTGTKQEIFDVNNPIYGLSTDISSLFRISPRITYTAGNFTIGAEVEYTGAYYGDTFDVYHMPAHTTYVANNRILVSTIYKF